MNPMTDDQTQNPTIAQVTEDAEADAALLLEADAPARAVQELLMQRHGLSKRDAYALVLRLRDR